MEKLLPITIYDLVEKLPLYAVDDIYFSKIYIVYELRNAWYGVLSDRYFSDVFFSDFDNARYFCENERKPGSWFRIVSLPCIVANNKNNINDCLVAVDINWDSPFDYVDINSLYDFVKSMRFCLSSFDFFVMMASEYFMKFYKKNIYVLRGKPQSLEKSHRCPSRKIWKSIFYGEYMHLEDIDNEKKYNTYYIRKLLNVLNGEM